MTEEKEGKSYDLEERLIDFHLLKMARAQRYHPSTFDILRFYGSLFPGSLVLRFAVQPLSPEP